METLEQQQWADCDAELAAIKTARNQPVARQLRESMAAWLGEKGPRPTLEVLVPALRCSGSSAPIAACRALSMVAAFEANPTDFVLQAFRQSTAPARGWMMRFVSPELGIAHRTIVELGLTDRSARVREWAAEGVDCGEYLDLIPTLRHMELHDSNADVRWAAGDVAAQLERGYSTKWDSTRRGWTVLVRENSRSILALFVHRSFADRVGWDAIEAIIRIDPRNSILDSE